MTDRPQLLSAAPHDEADSLEDLLGVANAIEVEAVARYDQLAELMERRGETETAAVFREMSEIEKHHVDAVARRAASLKQGVPSAPEFVWRLPPEIGGSWDDAQHSSLLTPYRALAIAVTNEERAFAYYSYIAARTTDPRLAELAEDLALDELDHAAELRVRRRRAYHREFPGSRAAAPARVDSLADFRNLELRLDAHIAEAHRDIAGRLAAAGDAESAALLADATKPGSAAELAARRPFAAESRGEAVLLLHGALRPLEAASEVYEDLIARAEQEDVLTAAQTALRRAVERISILGHRIHEIESRG